MPTLLLRLAAPLQSWGGDCKFEIRKTQRAPTKSGVIGLLAAALGWKRDNDEGLIRLNTLKFGVRIDRQGQNIVDYQSVHGEKTYITYRHYLSDAVFLAGLESEDIGFLYEMENALKNPIFPLFLGRRSCPPTLPIVIGIRESGLEQALTKEPALIERLNATNSFRVQLETKDSEVAATCPDVAISFNPQKRCYGYRKVKEFYVNLVTEVDTEHDAMSELR